MNTARQSIENSSNHPRLLIRNANRAFVVDDVLPDLSRQSVKAAFIVGLKPAPEGTVIYLRVAPGLSNRDVEGFLSDLLQLVKRES